MGILLSDYQASLNVSIKEHCLSKKTYLQKAFMSLTDPTCFIMRSAAGRIWQVLGSENTEISNFVRIKYLKELCLQEAQHSI